MKELTNSQIKKAYIILDILCKNDFMDVNKMYSMFKTVDEAESVCYYLATEKMLNMDKANNRIYSLRKGDKTCIVKINRLLSKNPTLSKFINNAIFQVMGLVVLLYTFFKIIEVIFKIDIPII